MIALKSIILRGRILVFTVLFLTILASPSTSATVYYVAMYGDDGNPGTEALPWQTVGKAARSLVAGDAVYIKAGAYNERIIPENSGSAGNYILYAAYPGDEATIDGNGISVPEDEGLFHISGKRFIKVSGLRVINAVQAGIYVNASSNDVLIEKNYTYNAGSSGIGVWNSRNIIIDGNEVASSCSNGWQENITVAGVDGFEVRNNHVHNEMPGYKKEGICLKDGSAHGKVYGNHVHHTVAVGIYLDAWDKHTHDIEVFRNIVHHSLNDGITLASEMGGLLENIRIYNNIAYDNHFSGIALNRNGPASTLLQPLRNVEIINNTLCQNGQSGWGGGISVGNPDVEDIVIRNNICSRNVSFQLAVDTAVKDSELAVDHNLIDGFRGYVDEGGMEIIGSDAREGDSRFADASAANYHLQESSPAVDMGSDLSVPDDDMEGNMRPRGAGYDAGAYEYDAGMIEDGHDITVTTGPNGSVSCVPNPVPAGENSICTVAPSAGYRVDAFECDGSPVTLADHQYVFNSVTANHTVNATFKIDLRGDVDHDGIVDPDDAVMLMKVISGMTPVQSLDEDADINGDGKTGLTEVLFILQRAAGLR